MYFSHGHFAPFSIRTYAIVFIVAVTLLFSVSSLLMLNKIATTRADIERNSERAANAEIAQAVLQLSKEMDQLGHSLVSWDETRQQLSDPSYYIYWRDSRVAEGGILPAYVKAVELTIARLGPLPRNPCPACRAWRRSWLKAR